ncbi:RNA polymerase factor sigma-54 [Endozoicomonas sp. Mp262]|uniref:RNA polymerase factor sigma-54 n=1 Tax=Endozoicomonas sp. Mp262 TaxID=2919499 RepID=UPI0021E0171F
MKPSLQLTMGQQLTMTPQLQQAIRLLQLSTLDLQQEIQEILESNPMLEAEEDNSANTASEEQYQGEQPPDFSDSPRQETTKEETEWNNEIPSELPLDSKWDDIYPSAPATPVSDEDLDPFAKNRTVDTLQDYLEWQLNMAPMSDLDRLIGLTIIESVNANGYLTTPIEDIFKTLHQQFEELELDEVMVLQHRIQQFDPVGCASHDLRECLTVQLNQLADSTDYMDIAAQLIDKHLPALGNHDYAGIMKKMKLKEEPLREALSLIQSLNPHPGSEIEQPASEYIIPDIMVRKFKNSWQVELNAEALPRLRINNNYASMVQRANSSRDNVFMKNHLQEAKWFLKNLQSRNDTLLKVARKIVEYQYDFFNQGEEAMKPLVLADIADAVGMHESTISRVTTQKYMHTPRGVYELKFFFSSHVSTAGGGECSSTAIRALIKKIVAEENSRKPLSDNKIALLLGEQGIKVARRTIAKYRESLHIPPSNERKRLV